MNEEQVRQIFREELASLMSGDRFTFQKNIQIFDARNIQLGKKNGTMVGTEATQKLGFYGVTPIVQTGAIAAPSGGATVDGSARTAITAIINLLHNIGLTQ